MGISQENKDIIALENESLRKEILALEKKLQASEKNQEAILLQEENLRITLECIGDAVIVTDNESVITNINPIASSLTGWTKKEAIGQKLHDVFRIYNSKTRELAENPVDKVMTSGKIVGLANDTLLLSKDGSEFQIADSGSPIKNKKGEIIGVVLVFRDVTEEYRMQESIRNSENKYRAIFQNTGTATVIIEADKTISLANAEFAKLTGYQIHEIEGKLKWTQFVFPEDLEFMVKQHNLRRVEAKEAMTDYEFRLLDRKKNIKHILLRVGVIPETGQSVASLQDLSERKRIESALSESEKDYRLLVENQTDLVVKVDTSNRFLFVSESYCRMFGKSEEELLGKTFMPLVKEEDQALTQKSLQSLFSEPYISYHEQRAMTVNGWRWLAWQNSAVLDENGEVYEIIGVGRDIHEKKLIEMEIAEHERQLSSIVSNLPGFVYRCQLDEFWTMHFISPQIETLTGYKADELINNRILPFNDIIHEDDQEKVAADWEEVLGHRNYYMGEYRIVCKNGEIKWVSEKGVPVYDEEGNVRFLEGYIVDISESKKLISDLVEAKEKAEDSDRLKTAFLANMSHEIRTPMNGILGFTELLSEPHLSGAEKKEYIEIIQRSGNRMLNTVNDIITISKIETGQETLMYSDLEFVSEIHDICKMLTPDALKNGVHLSVDLDSLNEKERIHVDRSKFASIMTNLLKNAIKFTQEGFVKVLVRKKGDQYQFSVEDSGMGIPESRQAAIFEPFIQGDLDDVKALEGSGLGLAISKSYVEMMGGSMSLTSTPGKGSVFTFTLPDQKTETVEDEKPVQEKNPVGEMLNILIVEDDYASVKYLNIVLKDVAKQLMIVRDGLAAVDHVRRHKDIDLILLDIKLPSMNGYEASKKIREFNKDVLIIAQTAYAISGDREKALKAGCDEYVSKPVAKSKLLDTIQSLLKR